MNKKVSITLASIAAVILVFLFLPGGIEKKISKADKTVLRVLKGCGINENDITRRVEEPWQEGSRAKALYYEFKPAKPVKTDAIVKKLEKALHGIRGVYVDETSFRKGTGLVGTANFVIAYRGESIISVKIRNALAGLAKKEHKVVKPPKGVKPKAARGKETIVALVLDDFGYTRKNLEAIRDLDIDLTLAVLPGTPFARQVGTFASDNGLDVIIHMPMEPKGENEPLENDTLLAKMKPAEIKNIVGRAFDVLPGARGMNNHMGSKATEDENFMTNVFKELKKRGVFFLDSLTAMESVGRRSSEKTGVTYLKRDIFIDNSPDGELIARQMDALVRESRSRGYAVAIGHDRSSTVRALEEIVPKLKKQGVKFVTLTEIVKIRHDNGRY